METTTKQSFVEKAGDRLAGLRGSLLLFGQGRMSPAELIEASHKLVQFQFEADSNGLKDIGRLSAETAYTIELLSQASDTKRELLANKSLDLISRLEAEVLQIPLTSSEFHDDVEDLVEASFEKHIDGGDAGADEWTDADFELDDETLEIFRAEADGILANIATHINTLRNSPDDKDALWEIRRNAHTFKGAAGIIGFTEASELAHSIEDLLDKMVEVGSTANGRVVNMLSIAHQQLCEMAVGKQVNEEKAELSAGLGELIATIADPPAEEEPVVAAVVVEKSEDKPTPTVETKPEDPSTVTPMPVVRVSLERLDDLLRLVQETITENALIAATIAELQPQLPHDSAAVAKVTSLIEMQRTRAMEIQDRLRQIRMVRFGVLEMRLNRAVHVTCQEESKKVEVVIHNPDVEVDTLVIDAMIEPLLHLLKNAVVHGIELPEIRRIVGKPEKGVIGIRVESDGKDIVLSVEDDGRGISATKLIERALSSGILDKKAVESMDEVAAQNLIFHRGLTTAETLNMNAGRGVGMSIVKESVESRGGSLKVESELQRGTKFTLKMPVDLLPAPEKEPEAPVVLDVKPELPLVLVVDDSSSVRRMTAKMVEGSGCRVMTAINGAEALQLLLATDQVPDLILSDVEMPNLDGFQLLEQVKKDEHFGKIPVVMVTSLKEPEHKERAFGLGAADYLVKPFSVAEFGRIKAKIFNGVV